MYSHSNVELSVAIFMERTSSILFVLGNNNDSSIVPTVYSMHYFLEIFSIVLRKKAVVGCKKQSYTLYIAVEKTNMYMHVECRK